MIKTALLFLFAFGIIIATASMFTANRLKKEPEYRDVWIVQHGYGFYSFLLILFCSAVAILLN